MSGRPCNPGSDLRALWHTLLGNVPLPQCGMPEQADPPQDRVPASRPERLLDIDQVPDICRER